MAEIILASASPRRRELLAAIVDDFVVAAADVPEPLSGDGRADALRLARAKADAAARRAPGSLVIAADTVVHQGPQVYGKPETPAEAVAMLAALRGREHIVTTAIAVGRDGCFAVEASDARVEMAPLSDAQIEAYVRSGRPMDKAGAYAIQDADVPTVSSLDGCYCCVMGLPLFRVASLLERADVRCRDPRASLAQCAACPEASGEVAEP